MTANEVLLRQRNQILGGLREGFIALTIDGDSIIFSNEASKQILISKKMETIGMQREPMRALEVDDLNQEVFSKVDPKLLSKNLESGETTFREKIRSIDDYVSLSYILGSNFDQYSDNENANLL